MIFTEPTSAQAQAQPSPNLAHCTRNVRPYHKGAHSQVQVQFKEQVELLMLYMYFYMIIFATCFFFLYLSSTFAAVINLTCPAALPCPDKAALSLSIIELNRLQSIYRVLRVVTVRPHKYAYKYSV